MLSYHDVTNAAASAVGHFFVGLVFGFSRERLVLSTFLRGRLRSSAHASSVRVADGSAGSSVGSAAAIVGVSIAAAIANSSFTLARVPSIIGFVMMASAGAACGQSLQPICVTGGIATGKSTTVRAIQECAGPRSVAVIDLDTIGHSVLYPPTSDGSGGQAYWRVVKAFGTEHDIFEGSLERQQTVKLDGGGRASSRIDRRKLGAVIFND
eukprot:CAMPEP_0194290452 /NCGR_PEP_ID=MMETSP0169-20130528/41270_1 /TAXON_ID=218684 /ORGANISM="Corethron pennatum, Strain L29A3" /LENGTH=209 /DNA_ID=CAMNT_0039038033 /DNA_START=36 /DNA_END=662 /DNA_ORIENTATION=+